MVARSVTGDAVAASVNSTIARQQFMLDPIARR
jgi:hypothetical protein